MQTWDRRNRRGNTSRPAGPCSLPGNFFSAHHGSDSPGSRQCGAPIPPAHVAAFAHGGRMVASS